MTAKRNRDRVNAEITLSLVMRLASEEGCPVTREQALAFLNRDGLAYKMWKQMMDAGVHFITRSLLRQRVTINDTKHSSLNRDRCM